MSHTAKIIWTGVLVVVIVIALMFIIGGAYKYTNRNSGNATSANNTMPKPPLSITSGPGTLPTGTNTSNKALNTDLSAIDSQLSGLNTDNENVDNSINDQPVAQTSL